MRRITLWIVSTVAAVVLLFSYRTSLSGPASTPGSTSGAQPAGVVAAGTPTPSASSSGKPTATKASSVSVNGTVAQTRWGPVQVQVHITGSKITDVVTLVSPSGNSHDQEINASALPQLRSQTLAAQSAQIDGVSGATVTSDGYRQSLQAALDAAHLHG
jgi:uncharacterized protein with FMN-binding domain